MDKALLQDPKFKKLIRKLADQATELADTLEEKAENRELAIEVLKRLEFSNTQAKKAVSELNPPPEMTAGEIVRKVLKPR